MAHILVVDDEPLIAMLAEDWLLELGHTVVGPAHDLSTGLALAQTNIDAAIIDITLGKDTAYPIAKILAAKGVPFAFATGHAPARLSPDHKSAAILEKPFEFDDFRRAVESMLAAR